jgi:hypothetical protein
MQASDPILFVDVELQPGEKLTLPESMAKIVGPGSWRILVQPIEEPVRDHSAFLSGYAPEDEGLYDDYPAR